MTIRLLQKLNERTDGAFSYLKLAHVEADIRKKSFVFHFIYPEDKQSAMDGAKARLTEALDAVIASQASVQYTFAMSHFDRDFFIARCLSFFEDYPSLASTVYADRFSFEEGDPIVVRLQMEEGACRYCREKGIFDRLQRFIDNNYCEHIVFQPQPYSEQKEEDSIDLILHSEPVYRLEKEGARLITPENVEEFIGGIIYEKASYIADVLSPRENVVVCGRVGDWQELTRKPAEGETEGKKFYKFTLTDFTGTARCIYFPTKKTISQITLLQNDKEVVVRGNMAQDTYHNQTTLTLRVRAISLCTLPAHFEENKILRLVADRYLKVFPARYVVEKQANLFAVEEKPDPYLLGKTFVAVDVETTGLFVDHCKIIEVAAVKIVDGKITETFDTFVDPRCEIPPGITDTTSITDQDVAGQPFIEDVLPDLYKFCYGCPIVGHNVQFDLDFLNEAGKVVHIVFDQQKYDTLALARTYLKDLKNYKLGTVLKEYGIVNKQAHRAIYDTVATAELFIKMAHFLGENG